MTQATSKQPNPVISDLKTWLEKTPEAVAPDWLCVPTPDRVTATINRDTASVWWLTQYAPPNNKRNPYPDRVIWDTTTRADKRTGVADNGSWFFRNQDRAYQFYWLDIGRNPEKFPQGNPPKPVYARYFKERNAIVVVDPGDHLGLLLHPEMLDLSRPVEITVGNDPPLVVQPKLTLKSLVRTLVSRGDPRFTFPARIDLEKDGESYTAVGGSTLRLEGPVGGDSRTVVEVPSKDGKVKSGPEFSGTGPATKATPGVTVFTATAAETRPIAGVTVWVNLQHAGGGDLQIEVISPAGTPVVLSGKQGGDLLDTTFDDTATTPIEGGSAKFKPEEPLSALIGESAAGTWRLRMVDATGTITGTLPLLGWKVFVRPAVSGN